jgi:hypothetical protein
MVGGGGSNRIQDIRKRANKPHYFHFVMMLSLPKFYPLLNLTLLIILKNFGEPLFPVVIAPPCGHYEERNRFGAGDHVLQSSHEEIDSF